MSVNIVEFPRQPLIFAANGTVKPNEANCMAVLREESYLNGVYYDEFRQRVWTGDNLPWAKGEDRRWTDFDTAKLCEILQNRDLNFKIQVVNVAIKTVAYERRKHPLREWLMGLRWDRVDRADYWLTYYMDAPKTRYVEAVAAAWLISAVARVMDPGCKADHIIVLEGKQGIGKSSALRAIAGEDWFTDDLAVMGSKDASLQLIGAWVVECAELDCMTKAEIGTTKAFISRRIDRYRPPYGAEVVPVPRQCVFAGTSNSDSYLKDDENRRYWPVKVSSADVEGLAKARDQLWAEAVRRYQQQEAHWLWSDDVKVMATEEQDERRETDAWESMVFEYLADKTDTSLSEILCRGLGLPLRDWGRTEQNRVSAMLKRDGTWMRYRGQANYQNVRPWRYAKKRGAD